MDLELGFKIGFIALFVFAIGLAIFLSIRARTESERNEWGRSPAKLGMEFLAKDDSLRQRLQSLRLFTLGHSRAVKNVIYGNTQAVDVSIFDYKYTTGGGKNKTTAHQSVASFEAGDLDLPGFQLALENILHRFAGMFGYQDINFESHPKFSKEYLLRGRDEERTRQLFRDDVLDFFEQRPGLSVEGDGHQLVVYRKGKRSKPEEIRELLEMSFAVYNQLRSMSA